MFGLFFSRQTTQDTNPAPRAEESNPAEPLLATSPDTAATSTEKMPRSKAPYEFPDPQGRCFLMEMPEELLVRVFTDLDRCTVSKCFRLNKSLNALLKSNSSIQLHYLLATQSLRLNPHALVAPADLAKTAPSSAQLLRKLRSRIDGFTNFTPAKTISTPLHESDGRLYEYLEGTLLRGVGDQLSLPFELAVYDIKSAVEKLEAETPPLASSGGASGDANEPSDEEESSTSSHRDGIAGSESAIVEHSDASAGSSTEMEIVFMDELEGDDDGNWTDAGSDIMGAEFLEDATSSDESSADESSIGAPLGVGAGIFISQGELEGEDAEAEDPSPQDRPCDPAPDPDIRRTKRFRFQIAEMATDPGQDLLVLVEVRADASQRGRMSHSMYIHLLSLSTFEPHPRAAQPVLRWPTGLSRRKVTLGFQICDDGLFIMNHNQHISVNDQINGWQWTTGRHAVTLKAYPIMSFESFVLLSPTAFAVPTVLTRVDPHSFLQGVLDDPSELTFSHHIHLFAFPPFSSVGVPANEPHAPPHTATHIATIDLPDFRTDLAGNLPPPRLSLRTDPPPRHTMPTHPIDRVAAFDPEPTSGVCVMEVYCQDPNRHPDPHFVMCFLKSALLQYLPAPTSPLLREAFPRPAPVVSWQTFAPKVRMFGPDLTPSSWVCYLYQNRYVAPLEINGRQLIRLYDFDPLRVRKARLEQAHKRSDKGHPASGSLLRGRLHVVTDESVIPEVCPLRGETRTGANLPYTYIDLHLDAYTVLIDSERIIALQRPTFGSPWQRKINLRIMEF